MLKRTYVVMKNGDVFDFGQNDKYPSTWGTPAGPKIVAEDIKERVGRPNSRALPLWLAGGRAYRAAAARRLGALCIRRPAPRQGLTTWHVGKFTCWFM